MDANERRGRLERRYRSIRNVSMRLVETLSAEDCAAQSMPDASPAKWHLAHTTWFFETFVLKTALSGYAIFHPRFEYLFNSYYNSVGAQYSRPERGLLTRPTLEEVGDYRTHVDSAMLVLFERESACSDALLDVVELGLNHEQQHQELLLTDIKHLLGRNPLAPVYRPAKETLATPIRSLRWHLQPGGVVSVGHEGHGFAFDNESPRHRVHLEPFAIASRPIRNGEFKAFIDDGGYHRPELWLSEGWAKVQETGWTAPLYWTEQDGRPATFTLGGLLPAWRRQSVT